MGTQEAGSFEIYGDAAFSDSSGNAGGDATSVYTAQPRAEPMSRNRPACTSGGCYDGNTATRITITSGPMPRTSCSPGVWPRRPRGPTGVRGTQQSASTDRRTPHAHRGRLRRHREPGRSTQWSRTTRPILSSDAVVFPASITYHPSQASPRVTPSSFCVSCASYRLQVDRRRDLQQHRVVHGYREFPGVRRDGEHTARVELRWCDMHGRGWPFHHAAVKRHVNGPD